MKWSQVPLGTVITGLVAVYGASLSTYLAWRQKQRDRYNIRVTVAPALVGSQGGPIPAVILFEVQNAGYRPVEVTAIYLHLPKKQKLAFPRLASSSPFPHRLEEGRKLTAWIPMRELAHGLISKGYSGTLKVKAECTDALDNRYFSDPMDVNVEALTKLGTDE